MGLKHNVNNGASGDCQSHSIINSSIVYLVKNINMGKSVIINDSFDRR